MNQVLTEVDNLIHLLERQIPANPHSPENLELGAPLAKKLSKYFLDLANAFPYHRLDKVYNTYVKESITSDSDALLNTLLATFNHILKIHFDDFITMVYLKGSAEMIACGKTKGGIPIAFEGPPVSEAIKIAKERSRWLIKEMNTATQEQLRNIIANSIKNKRGVPGLARDIRGAFDNMSKYRSEMIARTETANALSQASLDRMNDMGVSGKEWIGYNPCPICLKNESAGIIKRDASFPSGDLAPPAHPNCQCAVAPARLPGI